MFEPISNGMGGYQEYNDILTRGRIPASNDSLLDQTFERFPSRDNEGSRAINHSTEEVDELVDNLRKKLETWGDEPLEIDEDIEQFNNSWRASLKNDASDY